MGAREGIILLIHDIQKRNVALGRSLPAKSSRPFKIVYAANKIEVDVRKFEAFPGATSSEDAEGALFRHLGMPLSTSSTSPPLAVVGPNEKLPYVEFWGVIAIDGGNATVEVGKRLVQGKIPSTLATLSLGATGKGKREYSPSQETVYRKTLSGYSAGGGSLEDAYQKSVVFEEGVDFVMPEKRIKEVCDVLFDHVAQKLQRHISETESAGGGDKRSRGTRSMSFKVFVLPTKDKIAWDDPGRPSEAFVDVFGVESTTRAPDKATFNAKFLSIDDQSFTIKCRTKKSDVYDDLNLSKESYMQINLHKEDLFFLAGLWWYFGTAEEAKNRKRRPREGEEGEQVVKRSGIKRHGFYAQIRDMAEAEWSDHRIMCLKQDNAKVGILLDEHCPLSAIKNRLLKDKEGRLRYSPMALEKLIHDKDWNLYMDAVRAMIHGRKIARYRIVSRLTAVMRKKMRGDASTKDIAGLFSPGLFCLEAIADGGGGKFAGLRDDEHFAHCVGVAAMHFARLRTSKNPERDALLTRPVYDRDTLRSVLSKVVSGLALRLDDQKTAGTLAACSQAISWSRKHEIPEQNSRANLSYFFYAGAFSIIGAGSKNKGVEGNAGAG